MISLKKLLMEAAYAQYWWMSPDFELHMVAKSGHHRWAERYLELWKNKHPDDKRVPDDLEIGDLYRAMYNLGWVRVGLSSMMGENFLEFNHGGRIDSKQLKFLKDTAIEFHADILRDDTLGKVYRMD